MSEKIKDVINNVADAVENDVMPIAKKAIDDSKEFAEQASKKVSELASETGEKVDEIITVVKEDLHDAKLKADRIRLSPIFSSDELEDFEMVCITNKDKKHEESEVCNGSVGHIDNVKNGLKVLNIYQNNIDKFNFEYLPNCSCGFYYVSPVNPNQLINLKNYFQYIKDQRVSELHNIGRCIGASYVRTEYKEEIKTFISTKYKFNQKIDNNSKISTVKASGEENMSNEEKHYTDLSIKKESNYHDNEPKVPELKYFKDSDDIKGLIESALEGHVGDTHLQFSYNTGSFITKDIAAKIDVTLKKYDAGGNASFENEIENETRTELDFYVEFPKK